MNARSARGTILAAGVRLAQRGLAPGTSGNLSLRLDDDTFVLTPTNASLGDLDPQSLALVDANGALLDGDPPTKEAALHLAMYHARPHASAVVHLHAPYAVALSCLQHDDPRDVLPKLTPYAVMRIGALPLIPYAPPGDPALAQGVGREAREHHAVLLANHGPVVAGTSLDAAVAAIEELEEAARLSFTLAGFVTRPLTHEQVADLRARQSLR